MIPFGRLAVTPDADEARERVREILGRGSGGGTTDDAPRPLKGVLDWLGDRLRPIVEFLAEVYDTLGPLISWLLVAAIAALIAWSTATRVRTVRRRSRDGVIVPGALSPVESPSELEAAADAAERVGEYDRAVRLRFRAGLLRLDEASAIRYQPSIPTSEVRTTLADTRFGELADDFERIAYGGRDAHDADAERAKNEWPPVVDTARQKARR